MLFSVDDNRVHKDLKTAVKVFNVVSVRIWVRIRVKIRIRIRVRVTLIPMQMLPLMKKSIESLRNTMHSCQCPERSISCMNVTSYHNIYMSKD